ncbi:MAG: hypothetical protein Q8942_10940 [Bacillota bacterium]|nr:hypothetical protein [Bacillota bacterium]
MQHVSVINVSIYKRNIIYFFCSFIWAATISILPQVFFMTYYPEQKNTYLSLFLLLGTLASIAGILTSHNNSFYFSITENTGRRSFLAVCCIFTMAATYSGLFLVKNLFLYLVCFVLMKFISNLFYNFIDRFFVECSDQQQIRIHVQANLLFQLLGLMAAPLYFSFFSGNKILSISLIWVIAIFSLCYMMTDIRKMSTNSRKNKVLDRAFPQKKISRYHHLFTAYSLLILTAVNMMISMMIYILKDYYHFSNASEKGGVVIGVISVLAVITVLFSVVFVKPFTPIKNNHNVRQKFPVRANGIAIWGFILIIGAFYLKITDSFFILLCFCSFAGIFYGIFLYSTRNYASSASLNTGLISIYNNLPNYASLVGSLLILSVSLLAKTQAMDFSKLMLEIILVLFILALFALIKDRTL